MSHQPHIVIGWELGSNFGHIGHVANVARHLIPHARVTLLLQQPRVFANCAPVEAAACTVAELPISPHRLTAPFFSQDSREQFIPPLNFADDLWNLGWADRDGLADSVAHWERALIELAPDVLVGDVAPTALLAARRMGVASVSIGGGSCLPPAGLPMPRYRLPPLLADLQQRSGSADELVLSSINDCLRGRAETVTSIGELFESGDDMVATHSIFDPYPRATPPRYLGPISGLSGGCVKIPPKKRDRQVFAYIRASHPATPSIVAALCGMAGEISPVVVIPDATPSLQDQLDQSLCEFSQQPIALTPEFLANCDLVIGHGGLGLPFDALSNAVPVMSFPSNIEQWAMTTEYCALAAGSAHMSALSPWEIRRQITATIDDVTAKTSAEDISIQLKRDCLTDPAHALSEMILAEARARKFI